MEEIKNILLNSWNNHKESFLYDCLETENNFYFINRNYSDESCDWTFLSFNKKENKISFRKGLVGIEDIPEISLKNIEYFLENGENMSLKEGVSFFGLDSNPPSLLAKKSIDVLTESIHNIQAKALIPKKDMIINEDKRIEKSGINILMQYLDKDALNVLKNVDNFQWKDYIFYSGTDEKAEFRRQAGKTFPLLANYLSSKFSLKQAIDNKESLNKSLIDVFGQDESGNNRLSKGIIKRLSGLDYPMNGLPIEKIIASLTEIPPDWFPKDKNEWDAFCDITATVGTVIPSITPNSLSTLYTGCQGKWQDFRERLCNVSTDTRPPEGMDENALKVFDDYIDRSVFKNMPKDKVLASALKLTENLSELPEGINPGENEENYDIGQILPYGVKREYIIDWLQRLYAPEISREKLKVSCMTVEDMIQSFADKVILPLSMNRSELKISLLNHMVRYDCKEEAAKILFSNMSATAIFENAQSFLTRSNEILNAGSGDIDDDEKIRRMEMLKAMKNSGLKEKLGLPSEESDKGWPALIPIVQTPNNVYICPLTESYLLKDEGRGYSGTGPTSQNQDGTKGLSICVGVGGYDNKCKKSGHHILSMRILDGDTDQKFERLACIEIGPISKDKPLNIIQFYTEHNRTPGQRAKSAMEWFKSEVNSGRIELNFDGVKSFLSSKSTDLDTVQNICGYNWRDRNNITRAMYPWGRFVGKQYRKMNTDSFAESEHIIKIAKQISPSISTDNTSATMKM